MSELVYTEQPDWKIPLSENGKPLPALRIVLVTVLRVSRSCEHFPDGFDLHLLQVSERDTVYTEQSDWEISLSENGTPPPVQRRARI